VAAEPLHRLVQTLRSTFNSDTLTDVELLARFRRDRDPAAVEAIVRRHGPRVLAACRKVLGADAEAEDAFQATFLVLLRNPAAVRQNASLGAWLYGVAHRISLQARARRLRRCRRVLPESPTPADDLPWREACAILHEELNRLPDATRLPLVLCYLDGLSRDEAAQQLGRTLNSVKKALEKGREVLRKRLSRRGVTLSAGLLSAVAAPVVESADAIPPAVEGLIRPSAAVAALARTASRPGVWTRAAGVGLAASVLAVGVALGFPGEPKGEPPPAKEMPGKPAGKKDEPRAEGPKGDRIATVRGRLALHDGRPYPNAELTLSIDVANSRGVRGWPSNEELLRLTTDADGRFQFEGLIGDMDYNAGYRVFQDKAGTSTSFRVATSCQPAGGAQ
jgi:RNA polymerase sigma factor (sigma-70 family)